MSIIRRILLIVFILIGIIILGVGGYVGYVTLNYYRIEDNKRMDIENPKENLLTLDKTYKASTYNLGFGAYLQDFTFFLDEGYMPDKKPTCGTESRAKSKDSVLYAINGAINEIKNLSTDFSFFQEVDLKADRSHHINQVEMISSSFNGYSSIYASNFHTPYLVYPPTKPIGASESGMVTLSKYKVTSSVRKSFTVTDNFILKQFDLDRCFNASYLPIKNSKKELVIVNVHMSAYDEGGLIRSKQMDELNAFLNSEYEKGNYIIAGGDFNHDLLTNNPSFSYNNGSLAFSDSFKQPTPDWISFLFNKEGKSPIDSKFRIIASDNTPSCRTVDLPWDKGFTYVATVDGFLVSDNIEVIAHKNIQTVNKIDNVAGFAYSDHEPATIDFKLK